MNSYPREDLGIAAELQRRRILYARPAREATPVMIPRPHLVIQQIYENSKYIPRSVDSIIDLVASLSDLSIEAIRSDRQRPILLSHARACIGILAKELHPLLSDRAIEDAMNRGAGLMDWWRKRHHDRLKHFPSYKALYATCREALK